MDYLDWIINNKECKNEKFDILEKKIDICFWGWLCFSSVVAIIILVALPFMEKENHIFFNIICIFITLCFTTYYIKQIVLTIKRKESKPIKNYSPSIMRCFKKSLIMWSNILMGALLGGLSVISKNTEIIFLVLSALSFAIGMGILSIKNLSE